MRVIISNLSSKRHFILFLVLVTVVFCATAQSSDDKFVLVIDAGHGGKDPGTVGDNVYEKDVVLPVSLILGEMITENYPDVEVIFTRDDDNFLELAERAEVANEADADLFISIHANAAGDEAAYGAETFVLGLHKSETTRTLMEKENSVILLEDNQEQYSDFDGSPESLIILEYMQNKHLEMSLAFAENIQDAFVGQGRKDRGEKQAGFVVLYRTTMPSVLVEIGFVSNGKEEAYLMSEEGQTEIASGIYSAFEEFKTEFDKTNGHTESVQPEDDDGNGNNAVAEENTDENTVSFKVQLHTSATHIELIPSNFKGITGVDEYISNGFYKYTVGSEKTYEDAKDLLADVKETGFNGAFIVAFKGEERIMDLQEAISLSQGQ